MLYYLNELLFNLLVTRLYIYTFSTAMLLLGNQSCRAAYQALCLSYNSDTAFVEMNHGLLHTLKKFMHEAKYGLNFLDSVVDESSEEKDQVMH